MASPAMPLTITTTATSGPVEETLGAVATPRRFSRPERARLPTTETASATSPASAPDLAGAGPFAADRPARRNLPTLTTDATGPVAPGDTKGPATRAA